MHTPATFGVGHYLTQANRAVTSTYNKLQQAEINVVQIENQLGVEVRWTSDHPGYITTVKNLTHRSYRLALDELERLVVQRLFELAKLNMSRTGGYFTSHLSIALTMLYVQDINCESI
jgi:hypothetical protein